MRSRFVIAFAIVLSACSKSPQKSPSVAAAGGYGPEGPAPQAMQPPAVSVPGSPAGASVATDDRVIGPGTTLGNLVVYPITSKHQADVGPLVMLDDALAKKEALVREADEGGSVNTLVIENKGQTPVFVIAGTIVKGGKQDRQIGQDFIVGAKETTPVDAFCVEHGRWTANRNGQATGNLFHTSDTITSSKVRAAGQYKKSQSEVWSKVSESNSVHGTQSSSDTFLATVDDAKITKERNELAARITATLDGVTPNEEVVGVAYAIDGQPKGARWFAHHKVFTMVEKKLASGIALDAITAKQELAASGKKTENKPAPTPAAVDAFLKEVQTQAVKERRDTQGANANDYRESEKAYGSSTMMKPKAGAAPPVKPVSVDVMAK